MIKQVWRSLALLVALPAWPQVPSAAGGPSQMRLPPPVNGGGYSTEVGSEARSNYLRALVGFTTSYSNDIVGENSVTPVSDVGYVIVPGIEIDKKTTRLHLILNYTPSFIFYQKTNAENQIDQNMTATAQYRVTRYITMTLRDSFQKSGNGNQLNGVNQVSGGPPTSNEVIDLVANQIGNLADAELTYQFSRNRMIGGEGTFTNLNYLQVVPGLFNSSSSSGSVFYSQRLSRNDYIGATYAYSKILAYPPNTTSEIQMNTYLLFYTIYPKPTLSLSVSAGPQHYELVQYPVPSTTSWQPTITASAGWQGPHTNLAASYSRSITGGGGLAGVYESSTASVAARWKLASTWTVSGSGNYVSNDDLTPSAFISTGGGHRLLGGILAEHQLSERFKLEFGYTRLHQSYSGVPSITNSPNINREFVTITYNFARPLGG